MRRSERPLFTMGDCWLSYWWGFLVGATSGALCGYVLWGLS